MSRLSGLCVVYPAKDVVGIESGASADCGGAAVVAVAVAAVAGEGDFCCGGSRTGTPVREWRRGGIIDTDCDGGVRMRRRLGLAMCLTCGLEGSAEVEVAKVMMEGFALCSGLCSNGFLEEDFKSWISS